MRRLLSVLFACWFGLISSDLPMLHACAMHQGGAQEAAHGHTAHGSAERVPRTDERTSEGDLAHCQCLGECSGAFVSAIPRTVGTLGATVYTEPPTPDAARAHAATRGAHLLPFAIGPPGPQTT